MNVNVQSAGNFLNLNRMAYGGLKSVQQKQERQEKCANQVAFFEKQKENLKNMECGSVDEIARKLDMLHSYEDQIEAAKQEYNNSQMMHVMDEAMERGEQMAKAAEKTAPKTEEERKEDLREEAMGTEEDDGILEEVMDGIAETAEEIAKENMEESRKAQEQLEEQASLESQDMAGQEQLEEGPGVFGPQVFKDMARDEWQYQHIDYKI